MGSDVDGDVLGEEFNGYTFRITGGNDKQGFAMKQGILFNGRVRILMRKSKSLIFNIINAFKDRHGLTTNLIHYLTVDKTFYLGSLNFFVSISMAL